MWTASSAKRTTADPASAEEYTATDLTPSSRQARATRRAISPRLAIRIRSNMSVSASSPAGVRRSACLLHGAGLAGLLYGFDVHQHLLELDHLSVSNRDLEDSTRTGGRDRVHDLH